MPLDYDEYDNIGQVNIEEVKNLLIEIKGSKLKVNTPISEEHYTLVTRIDVLAYKLYKDLIYNNVDFSIKGFNRNEINDEEVDKQFKFSNYFKKNRSVIYELIAYKFTRKNKYHNGTYRHLFYCTIFSKYTNKYEDIFFVKANKKFILLDTEGCLKHECSITDFFIDYLGVTYEHMYDIEKGLKEIYNNSKKNHEEVQELLYAFAEELNKKLIIDFRMTEGVITFCDFLGWKGLWRKDSIDYLREASQLISDIEEKMNEIVKNKIPYSEFCNISRLISISDTIAILTPKVSFLSEQEMIEIHADISKYILEASTKKCFAIRGAITYGEYSYKGNIMLGPGIDESASWHEKADWIGISLSPSSEIIIEDWQTSGSIVKHLVPMKDKSPQLNYCVNWSIDKKTYKNLIDRTKALTPEIAAKYINTRKFLKGEWDNEK